MRTGSSHNLHLRYLDGAIYKSPSYPVVPFGKMRPCLVVLILAATATVVVRCQEADLDELLGDEGSGSGDYEVFEVR